MSPHQVIAVAVRLFAIWLLSGFAVNIPFHFLIDPGKGDSESALALIVGGVIVLILVVGLWRFPLTIAGKLLSPTAQQATDNQEPDLWLAMGCALIGLLFLTTAITGLAASIMQANSEVAVGHLNISTWPGLYLPKMIVGLWLVFGARGFRRVFWWARYGGYASLAKASSDETSD